MKADLTRNTFDPLKHFSRVLMQQGRVQLDADWNEQTAILLHFLRRLVVDLVGPTFSPAGGFTIEKLGDVSDDVLIKSGSYYLDGILCELQASPVPIVDWDATNNTITVASWTVDEVPYDIGQYLQIWEDAPPKTTPTLTAKVTKLDYTNKKLTLDPSPSALGPDKNIKYHASRVTTYLTQPDLPSPPALSSLTLEKGAKLQLYLDVWERLITYIEDDSIREVALNGPDTAARARVVWQVKMWNKGVASCLSSQTLTDELQPADRGLLQARTQPGQASTDPCTISPDLRYRGPENQLYRVEIYTGGVGKGSFKWSRENGDVVFPIVALAASGNTTSVTLANLGRDDRFGLTEGDYVEVQDDASVLANTPGRLLQVQSIDRTGLKVTLAGATSGELGRHPELHPLLRRWDHKAGDPKEHGLIIEKDGAAEIQSDVWLDLEDGVQIKFDTSKDTHFRTADYWLIPARVATGDVIWPTETSVDAQGKPVTDAQGKPVTNPVPMPPDGVTHAYAPLALVTLGTGAPTIETCQRIFLERNTLLAPAAAGAAPAPAPAAAPAPAPAPDQATPPSPVREATQEVMQMSFRA